jgi:hypothetical protein
MRKMSLCRCSCGAALRAVVEFTEAAEEEYEIALCPNCNDLVRIDGRIVELRVVDKGASASV